MIRICFSIKRKLKQIYIKNPDPQTVPNEKLPIVSQL